MGAAMLLNRTCSQCDQPFLTRNPRQRNCSHRCVVREDRKRYKNKDPVLVALFRQRNAALLRQRMGERARELARLQAMASPRPCRSCGKPLPWDGVRWRHFCNDECRQAQAKKRYAAREARLKVARKKARLQLLALEGKSTVAICVVCDKEYEVALRPFSAKTCSKACADTWDYLRERERARARYHQVRLARVGATCECIVCGEPIADTKLPERRKFCVACRRARSRQHHAARLRPKIIRMCQVCGGEFQTGYPWQITCSRPCRKAHERRKKHLHDRTGNDRVLLTAVKELLHGGDNDAA